MWGQVRKPGGPGESRSDGPPRGQPGHQRRGKEGGAFTGTQGEPERAELARERERVFKCVERVCVRRVCLMCVCVQGVTCICSVCVCVQLAYICLCECQCVSAEPHWVLWLGRAEALWELFALLDIDCQAPRDLPHVSLCVSVCLQLSVCVLAAAPGDPPSYPYLCFCSV